MSGIEDRPSAVTCIGDLPVVATDSKGKKRRLVIQGVRCVPNFTETLISVDSLWKDSRSEVRFADHRKIPSQTGFRHAFRKLSVTGIAAPCRLLSISFTSVECIRESR